MMACAPVPLKRTVESDVAGLVQDRLEAQLVGDGERRELDDDAWRGADAGDDAGHIHHGGRARQAGHDNRRVARDLGGVLGDDDTGLRRFVPRAGVGIEADHPPAAFDQIAADRASHDAEADHSNGLAHENLLPSR